IRFRNGASAGPKGWKPQGTDVPRSPGVLGLEAKRTSQNHDGVAPGSESCGSPSFNRRLADRSPRPGQQRLQAAQADGETASHQDAPPPESAETDVAHRRQQKASTQELPRNSDRDSQRDQN